MRVLIADDSPQRAKEYRRQLIGAILDWADTPTSAINYLSSSLEEDKKYDYVFLDHDFEITLGSFDKGNGNDIVKAMKEMDFSKFVTTHFVIHSLNSSNGAKNIAFTLHEMGLHYVRWKWAWQHVTVDNLPQQWNDRYAIEIKDPNDIESKVEAPLLKEGKDFSYDNGLMVLSKEFLQRRGACCQSECRNCPWEFKK